MKWTKRDLDKLKLKHNIQPSRKDKNAVKVSKTSLEKNHVSKVLFVFKNDGLIDNYIEELKFHSSRRWKFDWAIPSLKIGIEYEGLFSKKSRHTTPKGYSNDCIKYNEAQMEGWKVLRYTALNYKNIEKDLKKLLNL